VTSYVSPTQLQASINSSDVANVGSASVTVFNFSPGGGTSSPYTFTITASGNPMPSITDLSPPSVTEGSGTFTLTVIGSGFIQGSQVKWNNSDRVTSYVSPTQLHASINAADVASAGSASVTVTNPSPGGGTSSPYTFIITDSGNPMPSITDLSPSSVPEGNGGFTLTVTGSGFINGSTVRWNSSNRTTSYVSPTQVQASISASDVVSEGSASVTVYNPSPGGGTSGAQTFMITASNPIPTLVGMTPTSIVEGGGDFLIEVYGTGFTDDSIVRWNNLNRTTYYFSDSTYLRATILTEDIANADIANITVYNPSPGGGTSGPQTFTIKTSNPVPSIGSLSPSSVTEGSGAFTLTVNGSGFISGSQLRWNGSNRTTSYVDPSQLQASIYASDVASVGTASVTVYNPSPGGGSSSSETFRIISSTLFRDFRVSNVSAYPNIIYSGDTTDITFAFSNLGTLNAFDVTNEIRLSSDTTISASDTLLGNRDHYVIAGGTWILSKTVTIPAGTPPSTYYIGIISDANNSYDEPDEANNIDYIEVTITELSEEPNIDFLDPPLRVAGSYWPYVYIHGSGFVGEVDVKWNGTTKSHSILSSSMIRVRTGDFDFINPGTATVQVFSNGVSSNTVIFDIPASYENDLITDAFVIDELPYSHIQDISFFSDSPDDPSFACSGCKEKTAWYQFTPVANGLLTIGTSYSNFDNAVAVFSGSPGDLTYEDCEDSQLRPSPLNVPVTAGITYYIEVAEYNCPTPSGTLYISVDFTPQTFSDVPFDHPHHQYIQALYDGGYTAGCSTDPLMYCPDMIMDRAQSGVFMLRGNFGADFIPPVEPWDTFADDWSPGTWAEKWAEGMWEEGLTAGCNEDPLLYCPWEELPKEQASVFGLRMKYGMDYAPPAASGTLFSDMTDVGYWGTKWAEQAYLDGLLPECGWIGSDPLFCPSEPVDRGWGAYLIVQAKDLPLN
jgi:hypothetical protein